MIETIAIHGYRSLRDLRLSLGALTVVAGANGTGKSSVYRALRLMTQIAHGRLIASLAAEGGLASTLWAGPESFGASVRRGEHPVQGTRRKEPVSLKLGFAGDDYGYAVDVGLPIPSASLFARDPVIKAETMWFGPRPSRHSTLAERHGASVRVRNKANEWVQALTSLDPWDSMMTHAGDPRECAELIALRDAMREWRFYDHFDCGAHAPARSAQIGTRTTVLAPDGRDLPAAIQTILEMGDGDALAETVDDAFPQSSLEISTRSGYFELQMRQHGLLRSLAMSELSDGTLRFLLLTAALLSPRPPALMVLNEPETSLHVDLLPALARLIARAATRSQLVVVSHAPALLKALQTQRDCRLITLTKSFGETLVDDDELPPWSWPSR